jgi:hypothetical protein
MWARNLRSIYLSTNQQPSLLVPSKFGRVEMKLTGAEKQRQKQRCKRRGKRKGNKKNRENGGKTIKN